jgi:exodeoxyribonuclease V gamma subunit
MAEVGPRLVAGILGLDDVDSGDIDLMGRLAELVGRLDDAVVAFTTTQPVVAWARAIGHVADAFTAPADADAWLCWTTWWTRRAPKAGPARSNWARPTSAR